MSALTERIRRRLNRVVEGFTSGDGALSFAQGGEDIIAYSLLMHRLGIEKPTYLDVGANHPTYLSNTYFFYRRGCYGACIEPEPSLYANLRRKRPKDICLNIGIGPRREVKDLYVLEDGGLNTFSEDTKNSIENSKSSKLSRVVKTELVPINEIIAAHFKPWPNFISLDVEGMDLEILRSLDFKAYRPEAFCVETLDFSTAQRLHDIPDFMSTVGYTVYADTHVNTIFVESGAWDRSRRGLR